MFVVCLLFSIDKYSFLLCFGFFVDSGLCDFYWRGEPLSKQICCFRTGYVYIFWCTIGSPVLCYTSTVRGCCACNHRGHGPVNRRQHDAPAAASMSRNGDSDDDDENRVGTGKQPKSAAKKPRAAAVSDEDDSYEDEDDSDEDEEEVSVEGQPLARV